MMEKRDNWFVNYQEIPELGIKGSRLLGNRLAFYDESDFKNASVLDVGCNIGQMVFQAQKWGAAKVMGVEYDKTAYKKALEIKDRLGCQVDFIFDDAENPMFWNKVKPVDVCLFLSLIDTKELDVPYSILSKACMKTNKVMYFEGHGANVNSISKYMNDLFYYTDFSEIVYRGQSDGRPFIRAARRVLGMDAFIKSVLESKAKRIAVVGKAMVGKTRLRTRLEEVGGCHHTIIDDLLIGYKKFYGGDFHDSIEKLNKESDWILFDYRALKYAEQVDALYQVIDDDIGGQRINEADWIRSSPFKTGILTEFYTVKL